MERRHEEAIGKLVASLYSAFTPDAERIKVVLSRIVSFTPQDRPLQFDLDTSVYATEPRKSKARRAELQKELDGDAQCQFVSESYLYNLLGKEDARTLLSLFRQLAEIFGWDLDDLYLDCPGCGRAVNHSGPCIEEADDKKRRAAGMKTLREEVASGKR